MLQWLLVGMSLRAVARSLWPSRRTISRWWRWLRARCDVHGFHLRSRFAELGRAMDWKAFWSLCLARMSLGEAMGWLDRVAVDVP